jgi:hypothetical protein
MPVKALYQSKTIVTNLVILSVALYQHYFGVLVPADPQYFALAVAAINIALRFVTHTPVSF